MASADGDDGDSATAVSGSDLPLPVIDVDEGGTYKYVLIKLHDAPSNVKGLKGGMYIVRGHQWADYHADLVDEVESYISRNKINFQTEVVGGGRIAFNQDRKHIVIYGYSVAFGRANHSITCQLLKKQFPDYTVEWNNTGY